MDTAVEIVGARTRQLFWALSSGIEVNPLQACRAGAGFSPVEVSQVRSGGARKQVFSSFVEGVDWTDEGQVQRALRAFEGMLEECTGSYGWGETLAKITAALARDGYQVSPSLQILPVCEWRPEVARHDAKAYAESLRLLRGARNAMERSNLLTTSMSEERLRDVLLVALNAYFEGQSTGETLNGKGKTDILIRIGDRNVSISECKFHDGPKSVTEALDQLLGYTDNGGRRTSLLIFYGRRTRTPGSPTPSLRSGPTRTASPSTPVAPTKTGSGGSLSGAVETRAGLPAPRWRSSPSSSPEHAGGRRTACCAPPTGRPIHGQLSLLLGRFGGDSVAGLHQPTPPRNGQPRQIPPGRTFVHHDRRPYWATTSPVP
ncbi:hypothetical protein OIE73_39115 [Streptomyces hirsutus]|uniref:Restriction endonuclease type IV Mrr domain-containing protein n=1 Tax=Streptomyces hirsutus TaxID=35620 RepID=A0ABZ1H0K8_9ACTN|nr:hypothetical protein [Streptomyces hirsutus]WSD11087.1 hypothetical protein OIE73_39115 [Streptomyces hirsutus]